MRIGSRQFKIVHEYLVTVAESDRMKNNTNFRNGLSFYELTLWKGKKQIYQVNIHCLIVVCITAWRPQFIRS